MDFRMTEEQRELAAGAARFAGSRLAGSATPGDWKECARFGLPGLAVPAEYGGSGLDALSVACVMESLGRATPRRGLLFSLNAQMWACQHPVVRFGSEKQKQRYLPGLCDGSIVGAHAMTEAESGSDAFALHTRAARHGTGWVLNGAKTFITNAPAADVFLVFATTDRSGKFASLCAFLVPRETPGLRVGPPMAMSGLDGAHLAEVVFHDCAVDADGLLGRPGLGMAIFNSAMTWERALMVATSVGAMRRQLDHTVQHARERRQFGRPIGEFQGVSHKIVQMRTRLDAARLLTRRAAWALDHAAKEADVYGAVAKIYVSESFVASSLDALQIHGASGLDKENELNGFLADSVAGRIYSGTSEVLGNYVARRMGL
jgi:alkylation response protein AidB-like acyl-CoA dehydrogenase